MANDTITEKQLIAISKKLKKKYPHWSLLISEGISKEKEWKSFSNKDCSRENARHIATGKIQSQFHRRLFMKVGAKILLNADAESEEMNNLINQIEK